MKPWEPEFLAHLDHITRCGLCYARSGKYCADGAALTTAYEVAYIGNTMTMHEIAKWLDADPSREDLREPLRNAIKRRIDANGKHKNE